MVILGETRVQDNYANGVKIFLAPVEEGCCKIYAKMSKLPRGEGSLSKYGIIYPMLANFDLFFNEESYL